jgi:hypothetical protein
MNDAMTKQVGGTHYKGMKIEPFEFGHANDYDPEVFSVMKYVSRHRAKNGVEDLKKALHIVDIRLVQIAKWGKPKRSSNCVPAKKFISENNIAGAEASILRKLHDWALHPNADHEARADAIKAELRDLIETYNKET